MTDSNLKSKKYKKGQGMFPSIKKNLFQDKVENQKATFGVGMKRILLGLLVGSVVSFASTIPNSTADKIVSWQDGAQYEFILEPSTSSIDTSRGHHSHSSHRSHHSHYSSRY